MNKSVAKEISKVIRQFFFFGAAVALTFFGMPVECRFKR
jgi:hypothetical protein